MVGYADDHAPLTTIPHKDNCVTAAARLNADLEALCEYGHQICSIKDFFIGGFNISNHPPLF